MTSVESESPRPERWGENLGYPSWFERIGPGVHDFFNTGNRGFMVPALKLGLGRYMSTPLTGYLMLLRTRGRKSGVMRDAPLGYLVSGEHIYAMAGFGPRTHWFQNIKADPHVEVLLPDRSISGFAEEVTDANELRTVLPALARTMAPLVTALGFGNPRRQSDAEIAASLAEFPLVRIRQTGLAAGPNDPGGWGWVVPNAVAAVALALWLRSVARRR